MTRWWRWGARAAAVLVGLALAVPALAWLASESVIERHYPLLSQDVPVSDKPDVIAHGHHVAKLAGCFGCHGDTLQGRLLPRDGGHFRIHAPNLTRTDFTDEELARAIRDGLKPDGKSLWAMPSESYTYMSVADVAAIVSYIRSLPPRGSIMPPPRFKRADRIAILEGTLEPVAVRLDEGGGSLDLGPRYQGGRYIARSDCSACHGLDLSGTARAPALEAVGHYSLRDFFGLMREGHAPDYHPTPTMHALAHDRFGDFKDYEVMALYDYLSARASALPPR